MRKTIAGILLSIPALVAYGADDFPEPFGLTWGMSENSLKKIGFTQVSDSGGLNIFSSLSVPKAWSKGETYVAITYKGKLIKVVANSTDFTNDLYGLEGKKNYDQLKSLLTQKYGTPSSNYEIFGQSLYKDSDEFYQCLEYAGCGGYISIFDYLGGVIALQLKGKRRGEGYLSIAYESPEFSAAKNAIEHGNIKSDADAF